MRKNWCIIVFMFLLVLPLVYAPLSNVFRLSIILLDSTSTLYEGKKLMNISVWDAHTGGNVLVNYTFNVSFDNGAGLMSINATFGLDSPRFIQIQVVGDNPIVPRVNISIVPVSLWAQNCSYSKGVTCSDITGGSDANYCADADTSDTTCSIIHSCNAVTYDVELDNGSLLRADNLTQRYLTITGNLTINASLNVHDSLIIGNVRLTNQSDNGLWKGNLNIYPKNSSNNQLLFAVYADLDETQVPHFAIKEIVPEQASPIVGSVMVINEIMSILNTTNITSCRAIQDKLGVPQSKQVDCNTSTTGADFIVTDDFLGGGDIVLKDAEGEYHMISDELQLSDEMSKNTTLSGIKGNITNGRLEISTIFNENLIVNIDAEIKDIGRQNDSIALIEGTNASPTINQIYYSDINNPVIANRNSFSEQAPGVATFIMGADFVYTSVIGAATGNELISGIYNRFLDDGSLYKSGFDISVSSTEINLTTGSIKVLITKIDINKEHSTNFTFEIHDDGVYHQHYALNDTDKYSTGEAISNNKYFNMVCGIVPTIDLVPSNGQVGNMVCIPQDKPSTEHTKAIDAELDQTFVKYFPPNDLLKKVFVPIVRVVMQRSGGDNTIQTLSTDFLFLDLRGTNIGIGGSPPTPGIQSHEDLSNLLWSIAGHTIDTNINLDGNTIYGGDGNFSKLNTTNLTVSNLNSCTAIETDEEGEFMCGVDDIGITGAITLNSSVHINDSHDAINISKLNIKGDLFVEGQNIDVGKNDVLRGNIDLFGGASGEQWGGVSYYYPSADWDDEVQFFYVGALQDILYISRQGEYDTTLDIKGNWGFEKNISIGETIKIGDYTLKQDGEDLFITRIGQKDINLSKTGITTFNEDVKIYSATNPTLFLSEGGSATKYTQLFDASATASRFSKITDTGNAVIHIEPQPLDGSSNAEVNFFRSTSTTGTVKSIWYKGDGSSTANIVLNAKTGDATFAGDVTVTGGIEGSTISVAVDAGTSGNDWCDKLDNIDIYNYDCVDCVITSSGDASTCAATAGGAKLCICEQLLP